MGRIANAQSSWAHFVKARQGGELTQNEKQIDFSNFVRGVYYLRLENETLKIVRD